MGFFDDEDRDELRDTLGNFIGEISRLDSDLVARDRLGNILGRYDERQNRTTDPIGNLIGIGDWLGSLFRR
jgi:hypothetical protein